jgi:hypothetical protein
MKKLFFSCFLVLLLASGCTNAQQATLQQQNAPLQQQYVNQTPNPVPVSNNDNDTLSNTSTYQNVSGNTVHSPAYDTNNEIPAGATAQCGDGTYSFSQNHSGTCSHHGGVSEWLQ